MWLLFVGAAKFDAGHDGEAVLWVNQSIELNPNHPTSHFLLGASLARLDRLEEARDAAHAGLELNPSLTITRYRSQTFSDNPVYLAGRERMYDGLRKAGLLEE